MSRQACVSIFASYSPMVRWTWQIICKVSVPGSNIWSCCRKRNPFYLPEYPALYYHAIPDTESFSVIRALSHTGPICSKACPGIDIMGKRIKAQIKFAAIAQSGSIFLNPRHFNSQNLVQQKTLRFQPLVFCGIRHFRQGRSCIVLITESKCWTGKRHYEQCQNPIHPALLCQVPVIIASWTPVPWSLSPGVTHPENMKYSVGVASRWVGFHCELHRKTSMAAFISLLLLNLCILLSLFCSEAPLLNHDKYLSVFQDQTALLPVHLVLFSPGSLCLFLLFVQHHRCKAGFNINWLTFKSFIERLKVFQDEMLLALAVLPAFFIVWNHHCFA